MEIPIQLLCTKKVLAVAVPRAVVKRLYRENPSGGLWKNLSVSSRLVWIHRAYLAHGGLPRHHVARNDPTPVVGATIRLYELYARPDQPQEDKQQIADEFDLALREHLMALAADENLPAIDLRPIIPECHFVRQRRPQGRRDYYIPIPPDVHHCEARHWPKLAKESQPKAWCPRCSHPCEKAMLNKLGRIGEQEDRIGARLFPMARLAWDEASLTEVFNKIGVSPKPEGLEHDEHYVTALGGYANRLHDIRERLFCKHEQHARLVPNFAYARTKDACYNKTFFYCEEHPHNPKHDAKPGRYFNHCWCCRRVIDSGESPYHKKEIDDHGFRHGLYYCFFCGAGPLPDKKTRACDIGTVCPKCGSEGSMVLEELDHRNARLRCVYPECKTEGGHVIEIPMRVIRNRGLNPSWLPKTDQEDGVGPMHGHGRPPEEEYDPFADAWRE